MYIYLFQNQKNQIYKNPQSLNLPKKREYLKKINTQNESLAKKLIDWQFLF